MKKHGQKRYFSLIFVPDQELDPRSYSMSYAKGRIILVVAVIMVLHMILGGFGYYQIFKLRKNATSLQKQNDDLRTNAGIVQEIYEEYNMMKQLVEKIQQAFGTELGLEGNLDVEPGLAFSTSEREALMGLTDAGSKAVTLDKDLYQNGMYYLTRGNRDFFDPEYLPTLLPVEGLVTTHFQSGTKYIVRPHEGIDIAAERGSPIRAAGAGTVLLASWTSELGNVIIIGHGGGLYSYYGHAKRVLVEKGDRVRRGQQIALLGSTGSSSGPHLHFEIWKDGQPLDPEKVLFALRDLESAVGN